MMKPAIQETQVTFRQLENGIYEIVFHDDSRSAVDAWMREVEAANHQYTPDDRVCYLIDGSQVKVPVAYAFLRSREYVRQHPERPRTRTAVLYRSDAPRPMLSILNMFIHWLRGNAREQARFFPASERDAAITWLLQTE